MAPMTSKLYVRTDEHGVVRIGATDISIDSVLAGFAQGLSPETIRQQYPSLTLEEVYGTIAHYLANRSEIDEYLRQQQKLWDELRAENERNPSPVVTRLKSLGRARGRV